MSSKLWFSGEAKLGFSALDKFLKKSKSAGRVDVEEAKMLFEGMIDALGMEHGPRIWEFCKLMHHLVKVKLFPLAIDCYKRLDSLGFSNLSIYNILLNCFYSMGEGRYAFSTLGLIMKRGYVPDRYSFTPLLKVLSGRNASEVLWLFSEMKEMGCAPDVVCYNSVIDGLSRSTRRSNREAALSLFFEGMVAAGVRRDVVTYNIVVNHFCKMQQVDRALEILRMMELDGQLPDTRTCNILMEGYISVGKPEEVRGIYMDMIEMKVKSDQVTQNILLKSYLLSKNVEDATSLFEKIKENCSSEAQARYAYATMIDGLCKVDQVRKAQEVFSDMRDKGISPTDIVYASLIGGLCKQGSMHRAEKLFAEMLLSGVTRNKFVYGSLIDGFVKKGRLDKANDLFLEMKAHGIPPNEFVYTSLIDGCMRFGKDEDALSLLKKMGEDEIRPTGALFNVMTNYYCKKGKPGQLHSWVKHMISVNQPFDIIGATSILNEMCKTGNISGAKTFFDQFESIGLRYDAIAYATLIDGYCQAGRLEEAHSLLLEMEAKGCHPDSVTFNIVMTAFASRKDFGRVRELFHRMKTLNIKPDMNTQCIMMESVMDLDKSELESWLNQNPQVATHGKGYLKGYNAAEDE